MSTVTCVPIQPKVIALYGGLASIYIDVEGEEAYVDVLVDADGRRLALGGRDQLRAIKEAVAAEGYEAMDADECPPTHPTPGTVRWWLAEKVPND